MGKPKSRMVMKKELQDRRKMRKEKKRAKKLRELEGEPKGIPKTIESLREKDITTIGNLEDPENSEVLNDINQDEFADYFKKSYEPKVLITFSDNPLTKTRTFGRELSRIIPHSQVLYRNRSSVKKMVQAATDREFTDILIINENQKQPNGLLVIHLPNGPTAHFKISNVKITTELRKDYKEMTEHRPEVILNNFGTRLGFTVSRMLAALFHYEPEFKGRRAVTFHNQRDFIFFSFNTIVNITEEDVVRCLKWDDLIPVIEQVLADVSNKKVIQPNRTIMTLPQQNGLFLTMPGMVNSSEVLACKMVSVYPNNEATYSLPAVMATITLFDAHTGKLKAVIDATLLTEWRTAAASTVAVEHLSNTKPSENTVLAVLGAGSQGRIHILAFNHHFGIKTVHLWNRTPSRAQKLAEELKKDFSINVVCFESIQDCVKLADVIVTATNTETPILLEEHIGDRDVTITAVGVGRTPHSELDVELYKKATIYVDSWASAKTELKDLVEGPFKVVGEIGQVITKRVQPDGKIRIFQSLGMAVEDCVAANFVYNAFVRDIEN